MLLLRPLHHEGGVLGPCPPKSLLVPLQARVNFCTSTRGPANFCPKTGHHKRLYMKQQDRSSEGDQVAQDFAMKTFFIFLVFNPKFEGKIRTKGG